MKEGKQFFKLDGPIGRKKYLMTIVFLSVYSFVACIVLGLFHAFVAVNKYNLILFVILWAIFLIPVITVTWVNYTKRLWDLLGDKANAIFYATAIWIANIATTFIPVVKYIWGAISLIISVILLLKKGKLVAQNKVRKNAE